MASAEKPIIIIKKKGGHGGHHGGAWKIAYADFVTAMMAFFMVMWLVNSADSVTKKQIASYFKRPGVFEMGSGTPLEIGGAGILDDAFAPPQPEEKDVEDGVVFTPRKRGYQEGPKVKSGEAKDVTGPKPGGVKDKTEGGNPWVDKRFIAKQEMELGDISRQIKQMLLTTPEMQALLGAVEVKMDSDGLIIDIMDTEKTSMFASGSPQILFDARAAFEKIAGIISKVPNEIELAGHTDGKPFSSQNNGYSNWELSADRANAARRLLQGFGVDPARMKSVIGKADTELKTPEDPYSSANRRITLKLKLGINKSVDLGKDPEALKNLEEMATVPIPQPSSSPAVRSLTAEDILKGTPETGAAIEPVTPTKPSADPTTADQVPTGMPKDKIFGDHPVIGPGFILGNY